MKKTSLGSMAWVRYAMIATIMMLGIANGVNAQEEKAVFGLKAGLNVSTTNGRAGNARVNNLGSKAGFHAGVTLDLCVAPQIYLFTGAEYSVKGFVIEESTNTEVTAAYLQVPVAIGTKLEIGKWGLFMNTGPYFAYGLGGKARKGNDEWDTFSDKLLKNFDFGFLLGIGLEQRKWRFGIISEIGFANILQKSDDNITLNNFNVGLSAGYKF